MKYLYPPAPAVAPLSFLSEATDEWQMEPKKNGDRIQYDGQTVYSRHGSALSAGRGVAQVKVFLGFLPQGYTVEGEWVRSQGTVWLFDLLEAETQPVYRLPLIERQNLLAQLVLRLDNPHIRMIPIALDGFASRYKEWANLGDEGVVFKRRASVYSGHPCRNIQTQDWLKRRFEWDKLLTRTL